MAEIIENNEIDTDTVSDEKLATLFCDSYRLCSELAVTLNKNFINNLCGTESLNFGISLSDNKLEVYSLQNWSLGKQCKLSGHSKKVTDLVFSNKNDSLLYSCSEDGKIKLWDIRAGGTNVMEYRDEKDEDLKPLETLDISCNDRVLCAGSQMVNDDAFIIFWDQRKPTPLGGYWNSHLDDITKVRFHKTKSDRIATASSDGLLNIFDISEQTEDEALTYSLNVENAIESIRWLNDETIISVTQDNQAQLWNCETGDSVARYSREKISRGIKRSREDEVYVVDAYNNTDNQFVLIAGSYGSDGNCLRSLEMVDKKLKPKGCFNGNKQIVRCCYYHKEKDLVITAGESGIISVWDKQSDNSSQINSNNIIKSMKKLNVNRNKPY